MAVVCTDFAQRSGDAGLELHHQLAYLVGTKSRVVACLDTDFAELGPFRLHIFLDCFESLAKIVALSEIYGLARIIHEAENAKGLQRGTKPLRDEQRTTKEAFA